MKRVGDNPPSRFPDRPIAESAAPWWVAKIKPRQEKAIASDFIKSNTEYYLPLVVKVTRRKDNNKPRKSVLPLFPGYISFCSAEKEVQNVYRTGRVVSVIPIKYQRRFMEELTQIYQAIEHGVQLEPVTMSYPVGTLVTVITGPLRGLNGIISRVQDSDRLFLSVTGLGQASMVIDASMVKPVETGPQNIHQ
jgi:transcription antitermination factor NusG